MPGRARLKRSERRAPGAEKSPARASASVRSDERGDTGAGAEAAGVVAVGGPDVDARAADVAAGVVDEEATEVAAAREQLDVVGKGKEPRVGGDDPRPRGIAAARVPLQAVRGEGHRDGLAGSGPSEEVRQLVEPRHEGARQMEPRRDERRGE